MGLIIMSRIKVLFAVNPFPLLQAALNAEINLILKVNIHLGLVV